jgi:chloramphenicol-sensitive protein RarD
LGYYMNPLFSIALGALLLGEKLSRAQLLAIGLAATAVLVLVIDGGGLPWAALGMMFTWGFYALGKKQLPIGPNQGFLLEVLILLPFALAYVAYLSTQGTSHFEAALSANTWLLLGCGVITAVPLMIYANGAKLLRLSTIGILQYIAPTIIFLIAVFVFDEPFGRARAIAFPLIWLALIVYTTSMVRQMRAKT